MTETTATAAAIPHTALGANESRRKRGFWWHFMEMVLSMFIGMLAVSLPLGVVYQLAGGPGVFGRPDVGALVMATSMSLGMAFWMRRRGHRWAPIAEMCAAMYIPFLVLFVPFWAGLLPGDVLMLAGHVLMLPAMLVAMLRRRAEYSGEHHTHVASATTSNRVVAFVGHRWPTLVALVMTLDNWVNPSVPTPWLMMILPVAYFVIGGVRGTLRGRGVVALQVAGLLGYLALVLVAISVNDDIARYLVAAGWLAHGAWDIAHHRANKVVPRGYAEWCAVVDIIIGLTILLFLP